MKFRLVTLAAIALLLGLSACTQKEPTNSLLPEGVEGTPIVFTATGLNFTATPSTRATVDNDWEGVKDVAVLVDGVLKVYTVTADDPNTTTTLSSDDPFYWTASRANLTVNSWWPYTPGDSNMPEVEVYANQSTQEYFAGSDYISAENQQVIYDDPTLSFSHRTARIQVNLTAGSDVSKEDFVDATVYLTNLTGIKEDGTVITTYKENDTTYHALAAPQTVAAGKALIHIRIGDDTYTYKTTEALTLQAGYRYTYNLEVNSLRVYMESCTITDWDDDTEVNSEAIDGEYFIFTAADLVAWNTAVQSNPSLNCTLVDNITITTETWTPVGTATNPYTGTFDGGGFTITGLSVTSDESYVGLIGYLGSEGEVKDLTLSDVTISGNNYVGAVAGYNVGAVTACSISGNVSGSGYVGGVVGNNAGSMTDVSFSGDVNGSTYVGGVAGSNSSTMTACYHASGSVTASGQNAGGVVGNNIGSVSACYALSSVSGSNRVGGVVGYISSGGITACYHASGTLEARSSDIGGVVGYNNAGSVTACYWGDYEDSNVSATGTFVDGTEVTWADAVTAMNSAFTVWQYEIVDDATYPSLK